MERKPLPSDKHAALMLIRDISEGLYAQTRFDDLEEIDETVEYRHQLIEQFFCDFRKTISEDDLAVFKRLQQDDQVFLKNLEENKLHIASQMAGNKKSKARMRLYTKISRQF